MLVLPGCASAPHELPLQPLAPDARVRLTTRERDAAGAWEDHVYVGRLVAIDRATLTLRLEGNTVDQVVEVPRQKVLIVEVINGSRHHLKEGALIGLGVGLAIGIATARGAGACPITSTCSSSTDEKANETIAKYASAGLAVGALIGFLARTELWDEVPMPPVPR